VVQNVNKESNSLEDIQNTSLESRSRWDMEEDQTTMLTDKLTCTGYGKHRDIESCVTRLRRG